MRRFIPSLTVLAALFHGFAGFADVSPATPVVVDDDGQIVGLLVQGGLEPEERAHIALEVDGQAGVLVQASRNTLGSTDLFFADTSCSGTPHAEHVGSATGLFGGSFFVVTFGGDLYAIDRAELVVSFDYESRFSSGVCFLESGILDNGIPATLVRTHFEGPTGDFYPWYRIEARQLAAAESAPSVPALTPVGLAALAVLIVAAGVSILHRWS